MRLNAGVLDILPNVAKYGSYEDPHLLEASLIVAHDSYGKSQLCLEQDLEKDYERTLKAAKGYRIDIKRKRKRKQDRKRQDIKERSEYLKNKKREVSGVVIADKIAEAQISGVIYEPVTPEKGKKMAENIRNKLSQQSR